MEIIIGDQLLFRGELVKVVGHASGGKIVIELKNGMELTVNSSELRLK
jgi:hypothetical protein